MNRHNLFIVIAIKISVAARQPSAQLYVDSVLKHNTKNRFTLDPFRNRQTSARSRARETTRSVLLAHGP